MRGFIMLADAARAHPDGTFSLLRGAIDRTYTPSNQPIHFRGSVVAHIKGSMNEAGPHDFRLRVLNEEGHPVAPDNEGNFVVPKGGGGANIIGDIQLILPAYGRYTFSLSVDKHELDTWELRAERAQPGGAKGGQ